MNVHHETGVFLHTYGQYIQPRSCDANSFLLWKYSGLPMIQGTAFSIEDNKRVDHFWNSYELSSSIGLSGTVDILNEKLDLEGKPAAYSDHSEEYAPSMYLLMQGMINETRDDDRIKRISALVEVGLLVPDDFIAALQDTNNVEQVFSLSNNILEFFDRTELYLGKPINPDYTDFLLAMKEKLVELKPTLEDDA